MEPNDINETLEKVDFKMIGIALIIFILVISGIGYVGLTLLSGSGDSAPTPENYQLDVSDNNIVVTQVSGDLQTENLIVNITYENGTSDTQSVTVNEVGSGQTVATISDSADIRLEWNGDTKVILAQATFDQDTGSSEGPDSSSLTIEDKNVSVGETIVYNISESDLDLDNVSSYQWDMGDGTIFTQRNISYSYPSEGQYEAILVVQMDDGSEITEDFIVNVETQGENENQTPQNVISELVVPQEVNVSEPVTFDVVLTNEQGSNGNYIWTTDSMVYNERTPTHTYNETGTYNVSVTVDIPGNQVDEQTTTINVVEPSTDDTNNTDTNDTDTNNTDDNTTNETTSGVSADISVVTQNNLTVEFNAQGSTANESIEAYEWSPESGVTNQTSSENHTYTYSTDGDYMAQVTIITESGETDVDSVNLTVTEANDSSTNNTSDTNETDNTTTTQDTDVTIELNNNGDQEWAVNSVSGATTDQILPNHNTGDPNPDIRLTQGQRYEFTGVPTEPWEESVTLEFTDIVRTPLLSQTKNAKYNDDTDVGWVDSNSTVEFTVTPELGENMTTYLSPESEDNMNGDIIISE